MIHFKASKHINHVFDKLKDKKKIVFVAMMELGWEVQKWAPVVNYYIKNNPQKQYIVATLPDRFDLYKGCSDYYPILIPELYLSLRPCGLFVKNMSLKYETSIITAINKKYPDMYICQPPASTDHKLFKSSLRDFDFSPRITNKKVIDELLVNAGDKRVITIASRHRKDSHARNWSEQKWQDLFTRVNGSGVFVMFIVGTDGSYIRPKEGGICLEDHNRQGTSTVGLTIEAIRASRILVGQQSGNPILSLLLGTPVISWGHSGIILDETIHNETPYLFFQDKNYSIDVDTIFQKILELTE